MLRRSGLSRRAMSMTFETFRQERGKVAALRVVSDWKMGKRGLVLYGPPGTGKTHLACAVANRLIRRGVFCRFLRTVQMPKQDNAEVERLSDPDEVPVLVLDDVGAEKGTERALECLYSVIDGRLWQGAPTIITTNYRPEDLQKRLDEGYPGYGARILSRLRELCDFVPVGGRDMRG